MAELKVCVVCGKKYKFCGHCNRISSDELWRNKYCSEDCRNIFKTCAKYEGKSLSADEAYDELVKYNFQNTNIKPSVKGTVEKILNNKTSVDDSPTEELKANEENVEVEKPKRRSRRRRKQIDE